MGPYWFAIGHLASPSISLSLIVARDLLRRGRSFDDAGRLGRSDPVACSIPLDRSNPFDDADPLDRSNPVAGSAPLDRSNPFDGADPLERSRAFDPAGIVPATAGPVP